jgi:hypothetical protein
MIDSCLIIIPLDHVPWKTSYRRGACDRSSAAAPRDVVLP